MERKDFFFLRNSCFSSWLWNIRNLRLAFITFTFIELPDRSEEKEEIIHLKQSSSVPCLNKSFTKKIVFISDLVPPTTDTFCYSPLAFLWEFITFISMFSLTFICFPLCDCCDVSMKDITIHDMTVHNRVDMTGVEKSIMSRFFSRHRQSFFFSPLRKISFWSKDQCETRMSL